MMFHSASKRCACRKYVYTNVYVYVFLQYVSSFGNILLYYIYIYIHTARMSLFGSNDTSYLSTCCWEGMAGFSGAAWWSVSQVLYIYIHKLI